MRYSSIVRRILETVVIVWSLLWAVTGVSVLAVALHEHHHHTENHDHHAAIEVVLHGHAHDGPSDHDHQLTAPLSASRSVWAGSSHAAVSIAGDLVDTGTCVGGSLFKSLSEPRDLGPPAYLMHCVFLT